jgi:hypothetical protein
MDGVEHGANERRFYVEHREDGQVTRLGELTGAPAHFRSLDPFLSRLPIEACGELLLIDSNTHEIVARRRVDPAQRSNQRNRPERSNGFSAGAMAWRSWRLQGRS